MSDQTTTTPAVERAAAERAALIAGLHELADYLADNPDIPAPKWAELNVYPNGADAEQITEVDRVASALGVKPTWSDDGQHYRAHRSFGPVRLGTVAISKTSMAEYTAVMSYRGAVQTESGAS